MRYATATSLVFLLLGTGCYTQIYLEPEVLSESIASPLPTPVPPDGGPIGPPPTFPPIERPILIVPPPPPPVIVVIASTIPAGDPTIIRSSGTQRPSDEQRDDRSSRPTSLPTRGR